MTGLCVGDGGENSGGERCGEKMDKFVRTRAIPPSPLRRGRDGSKVNRDGAANAICSSLKWEG
jgi:hypothetical protein